LPTIAGELRGNPDMPGPPAPMGPIDASVDPATIEQLRRQRMLSQRYGANTALTDPSFSGSTSLGGGGKNQLGV
jgi:hypothetical protein